MRDQRSSELASVNLNDLPCGLDSSACLFGRNHAAEFGWWSCNPDRNGICIALIVLIKRKSSRALQKMKKDGRH